MPLWELALQAVWAQTLTTLLLKLQTYPWIKSPLHFYGTSGLLPLTNLFLSHLLTPTTRTLPPCRQHCSTPPIIKILLMSLGFPGGSEVKASACNARDLGSIPGLGRSPGEGNGNPLQYSCLENPTDREACWATVHGVAKSQTRLRGFTSLNAPNRTR